VLLDAGTAEVKEAVSLKKKADPRAQCECLEAFGKRSAERRSREARRGPS